MPAEQCLLMDGAEARTREDELTAVGQATVPVCLAEEVAVQVTGPATAVTLVVERATRNPDGSNGAVNWAPADPEPVSGAPAAGLPPTTYESPGASWWRARCTALTGASVLVAISGRGARKWQG